MAIRRILIANRGEIAVRVIRTCERLGIETVLAASDADLDSLPARLADRARSASARRRPPQLPHVPDHRAGRPRRGLDAIHPGYGFLSERADLARLCEQEGVIFIGPTAAQMRRSATNCARGEAVAAGVPVVPGGPAASRPKRSPRPQDRRPLLVKAVGGGGGRGMKRVDDLARLEEALALASAEADAAFGDGRVYLERFVGRGRHVEVQVLGDGAGP